MPATSPYTPTVITTAMAASTATCCPNGAPATVPREMTMISADRMKSVRTAPLILSFSSATMSTDSSRHRVQQLVVVLLVLVRAVQEFVRQLFEALVAQEGAAQHQQRRDRPRA